MKTFTDLIFETDPRASLSLDYKDAKNAFMVFPNKYAISVLLGDRRKTGFYSNGIDTYEVAVMYNNQIVYNTGITNDVLPYQTAVEVTEIMKKIQNLKPL